MARYADRMRSMAEIFPCHFCFVQLGPGCLCCGYRRCVCVMVKSDGDQALNRCIRRGSYRRSMAGLPSKTLASGNGKIYQVLCSRDENRITYRYAKLSVKKNGNGRFVSKPPQVFNIPPSKEDVDDRFSKASWDIACLRIVENCKFGSVCLGVVLFKLGKGVAQVRLILVDVSDASSPSYQHAFTATVSIPANLESPVAVSNDRVPAVLKADVIDGPVVIFQCGHDKKKEGFHNFYCFSDSGLVHSPCTKESVKIKMIPGCPVWKGYQFVTTAPMRFLKSSASGPYAPLAIFAHTTCLCVSSPLSILPANRLGVRSIISPKYVPFVTTFCFDFSVEHNCTSSLSSLFDSAASVAMKPFALNVCIRSSYAVGEPDQQSSASLLCFRKGLLCSSTSLPTEGTDICCFCRDDTGDVSIAVHMAASKQCSVFVRATQTTVCMHLLETHNRVWGLRADDFVGNGRDQLVLFMEANENHEDSSIAPLVALAKDFVLSSDHLTASSAEASCILTQNQGTEKNETLKRRKTEGQQATVADDSGHQNQQLDTIANALGPRVQEGAIALKTLSEAVRHKKVRIEALKASIIKSTACKKHGFFRFISTTIQHCPISGLITWASTLENNATRDGILDSRGDIYNVSCSLVGAKTVLGSPAMIEISSKSTGPKICKIGSKAYVRVEGTLTSSAITVLLVVMQWWEKDPEGRFRLCGREIQRVTVPIWSNSVTEIDSATHSGARPKIPTMDSFLLCRYIFSQQPSLLKPREIEFAMQSIVSGLWEQERQVGQNIVRHDPFTRGALCKNGNFLRIFCKYCAWKDHGILEWRISPHLIWSDKHGRILSLLLQILPSVVPPGMIVHPTLLQPVVLDEMQRLVQLFLAENVVRGNDLTSAQIMTELSMHRFLAAACVDAGIRD